MLPCFTMFPAPELDLGDPQLLRGDLDELLDGEVHLRRSRSRAIAPVKTLFV